MVIALGIASILSTQRRMRRVRTLLAICASTLPLLLLLLERSGPEEIAQTTLVQASALGALLQAAGYTVIALSLWSRLSVALITLPIWGTGAVLLALSVPQPLRAPVLVALANCLVVMPIVGGVSRIGTRRFVAAQRVVEEERSRIVLEAVRAEVSRSINASLESCVGETNAIIDEIASSGDVSDEQRTRLAMLDGLIRVTIQVDPVLSGGFAQAASELVVRGFQTGVSFDVRVVDASQDVRPVNRNLIDSLAGILTTCDLEERVQVFHDEIEDFLIVTLRWSNDQIIPTDALDALQDCCSGDAPEDSDINRGLSVDVDYSNPSDPVEVTVTVARPILVAALV